MRREQKKKGVDVHLLFSYDHLKSDRKYILL